MRTLIIEPGAPALTFDQVTRHLRGDVADEEQYLMQEVLPAVQGVFERLTLCCATPTSLEQRQHGWPVASDGVRLSRGPVRAVTSIRYTDPQGQEVELPSALWRLRHVDEQTSRVVFLACPAVQDGSEIVISYSAGFDVVPPGARIWMLGHIGHAWVNRGDRDDVPAEPLPNLDICIEPWRRYAI